VRRVDHGGSFRPGDALAAEARFEVVGNPLRGPAPGEVVADVVRLLDQPRLRARRPVQADAPQRGEVGIVLRAGMSDPCGTDQRDTGRRENG
jgi:hypothetical protein